MRLRAHALIALTLAAALASASRAEDAPAAKSEAPKPSTPAAEAAKVEAAKAAAAPAVDAAVKAIDAQIAALKVNKADPTWKTHLKLPTVPKFDATKSYYARMHTNKGEMLIKLKPQVAPMHVTNFIYLSRLGFYDGIKFHRVIKGFMAQGGDPLGNGSGGPGYQFAGEFKADVKHDGPGVMSTANAGPGTDGSQFFIMFRAYPSLDGKYTIYGQVEEGLDVLKAIEAAGNPSDGPPLEPLSIRKVTIEVR